MDKKTLCNILGIHTTVTNMESVADEIVRNIGQLKGKYICLTNVHTTTLAKGNIEYRNVQNSAWMALPDGKPIAFVQRLFGFSDASQVPGPDLMPVLWRKTAGTGIRHYFYGSSEKTIRGLQECMEKQYPDTEVAGMYSPPYRPLSEEEDAEMVRRINESGADILWVGLGAPKQEQWMYDHRDRIHCLMIGVGAGFDFHAGTVKRAPHWMREHYMEWLYRLFQDPKRLWKRYVVTNVRFIFAVTGQLLRPGRNQWKRFYAKSDRKKLLVYAHYYYPDVAATGQILMELAEGMTEQFDTTILCTVPSYTGTIEERYTPKKYYPEVIHGIRVLRIRVPEFRKGYAVSRICNIMSYFYRAMIATFMVGKVDYVFSISQPPILGGMLGIYGKLVKRAKFIYNIQDFNPEQTGAVSYTRNGLVLKLMLAVDKFSCRMSDKVIVVGRDMVETLKKRFQGGKVPKHCCINNWIDEKAVYPMPGETKEVQEFKKRYGLEDKFVVMYSGNLGLYYDLLNLLKVMRKFEKYEDVVFAMIGEGSVRDELVNYAKEKQMKNVVFIPYQEKENLVYSLNAADVHWVVNAAGIKGVSVPSKLYGVMAAGKPIIGVLENGSEARLIIEDAKCGLLAEPGEYGKIEKNLEYMIERRQRRDELVQMGVRGREYLAEHLTKEISIQKYIQEILNS